MIANLPFVANATLAIAVSFGIARYGFGLFLPDMAADFNLTNAELGLISSGAYLGYFTASIVAMTLTVRTGARLMLLVGLSLATAGMALIATAQSTAFLVIGCALAGASPGLVFSPISEAISVLFRQGDQGPAFSTVNAGEGLGAVLSAVVFLFVMDWQSAWSVFVGLGVISILGILFSVPSRASAEVDGVPIAPMVWLPCGEAIALLLGSFVLGITTTVFWTFAGGLVGGQSIALFQAAVEMRAALWITLGLAGMAGVIAAPLLRRFGLRLTYAASIIATAAALCLSGLAINAQAIVLLSGGAFGLTYIMATSQLGAWAMKVYIDRPSSGFGLAFLIFAVGAVIGPAIAGYLAELVGLGPTFLVAGLMTLVNLLFLPRTK